MGNKPVHYMLWVLPDAALLDDVDHDDGDAVRRAAMIFCTLMFSFKARKAPADLNLDGLFTHTWLVEAGLESGAEIGVLDADEVEDSLEVIEDLVSDPQSTLPAVSWIDDDDHEAISDALAEGAESDFAAIHGVPDMDEETGSVEDAETIRGSAALATHAVLAFLTALRLASERDAGTVVFYCTDPDA